MSATPVVEALAANDAFASLRDGVARLRALEGDLGACLPQYLRANIAAASIQDGIVTLLTPHSALAARLRHLEPMLLAALRQRGWQVDALKVRIRPVPVTAPAAPKTAHLSAIGRACLDALRVALAPPPPRNALDDEVVARHRTR